MKTPTESIDLRSYNEVDHVIEKDKKRFKIFRKDYGSFHFMSDSEKDTQEWVDCVLIAMKKMPLFRRKSLKLPVPIPDALVALFDGTQKEGPEFLSFSKVVGKDKTVVFTLPG
eukprot:UN29143